MARWQSDLLIHCTLWSPINESILPFKARISIPAGMECVIRAIEWGPSEFNPLIPRRVSSDLGRDS